MKHFSQHTNKTMLVILTLFFCAHVSATPILFDFETGNDFLNPILTQDGLTITHSSTLPDITQLVNDSRSVPFEGNGSMRLTYNLSGDSAITGRVDFSSLLSEVSLWAINASSLSATFSISALSSTDSILSTLFVEPDNTYKLLNFSGLEPIAALQFSSSSVNIAYWDNLSATVIPTNSVPVPDMLPLLLLSLLFVIRKQRSSK